MYSAVFARVRDGAAPRVRPEAMQMVRGTSDVLQLEHELVQLACRNGQSEAMDDLPFFLSRPQIRKKTPYLLTLSASGTNDPRRNTPEAAVLLYEHAAAGFGVGIFATDETTGRRTIVAPSQERAGFAFLACRKLILEGAQCVLISFRHDDPAVDPSLEKLLEETGHALRWAVRERPVAGYLPFAANVDATLAQMGTRTRNHLRYYRKRAEQKLGAVFFDNVTISREDFLALNRSSAYAVPDEMAAWRYDSLKLLRQPVFYGLRDRDGHWLSLAGGRHTGGNLELHWQINRDDIPSHSMSTAMRACLIEHEVSRGTGRLYMEGGTTHSMGHAFVEEKATDLIVLRRSAIASVIPSLIRRFLPPENMLLKIFEDDDLQWKMVEKS